MKFKNLKTFTSIKTRLRQRPRDALCFETA